MGPRSTTDADVKGSSLYFPADKSDPTVQADSIAGKAILSTIGALALFVPHVGEGFKAGTEVVLMFMESKHADEEKAAQKKELQTMVNNLEANIKNFFREREQALDAVFMRNAIEGLANFAEEKVFEKKDRHQVQTIQASSILTDGGGHVS